MKKFLSIILVLAMTLSLAPIGAFAAGTVFSDVTGNEYYAEAALALEKLDIFTGYVDGTFGANKSITRSEMAAVVCRMIGKENDARNSKGATKFDDVPADHWASGYINVAAKEEIINGNGSGGFMPDDDVKYEEAIKMVVCGIGLGDDVESDPDDWSVGYIKAAEDNGITDNLRGRKGLASTRGDIAVMVYNGLCATVAAPVASVEAGTYYVNQLVTLKSDTEGVRIYYTTDGSEPTVDSKEYTSGNINISSTATLKAIAVKDDVLVSDVTSVEYKISRSTGGGSSGSSSGNTNGTTKYNVKFDLNYTGAKNPPDTQKIKKNDYAERPDDPEREGYIFTGWYTEKKCVYEFDFENTKITERITLYAGWEEETTEVYTVSFDLNYGGATDVPENQYVKKGEFATKPEEPTREGYRFDGWYISDSTKEIFDFNTAVTSNITLKAKWSSLNDNLTDDIIDYGDITDLMEDGIIDVIFDSNGNVQTIIGPFTDEQIVDEKSAADVLNSASSLFGDGFNVSASDIASEVIDSGEETEENIYRTNLFVDNTPVFGSEIILSTDALGNVTGLFSTYENDIWEVNTNASLTEEDAVEIAITSLVNREEIRNYLNSLVTSEKTIEAVEDEFKKSLKSDTMLAIYARGVDEPFLAYEVIINSKSEVFEDDGDIIDENDIDSLDALIHGDNEDDILSALISYTFDIYANGDNAGDIYLCVDNCENGWLYWSPTNEQVIDFNNKSQNVAMQKLTVVDVGDLDLSYYRLKDSGRNIETHQFASRVVNNSIAIAESTDSFNRATISLHSNLQKTYDYYKDNLSRNSYDNKGAKVTATLVTGVYDNACWNSSVGQFFFGRRTDEEYSAALDVVGHEFTHAVINYVVGPNGIHDTLTYQGETGALNEAYADIMGNLVEGKTNDDRWLQGEDSGKAGRSFVNPEDYDQPSHYSAIEQSQIIGSDWYNELDRYRDRDNEGVHIFSGIINHAAYLMMTDPRNSVISRYTWSKVFYHSLYRLQTDSQFINARGAIIASAKSLGFNAEQQQAIKDAFDAVGVSEPDSFRIVLTWDEEPNDLDSHLVGPGAIDKNNRFHIAHYQRSYFINGSYSSNTSQYAADLDYDDTTSYGPEVTTIYKLTPGDYYFFVHDFTNGYSESSTQLAKSGATVKVYRGSSVTPVRNGVFNVNTNSNGTYWNVFKLTINDDLSYSIDNINTYGSSEMYS